MSANAVGPVRLGIDALLVDPGAWLEGRRVGLVANQASLTSDGTPTLEALRAVPGVDLACLLTPEHGFSGYEDDATPVEDRVDARTGLRVYSLYGPRRRPEPAVLRELDAVVFDVQEVGVRCYTYATTLALLLEASRETGTRVVVCDRPNLLGPAVAGPALDPALRSFLGYLPVPYQHGLSIGGLARWWSQRLGGVDLRIAPLGAGPAHTDPFVPPSPSLPTRESVLLYPGLVLLEGTNLSEGRGTSLPFQLLGAPWLEGYRLARTLNALDLPGLLFRPLTFRPESGKLRGQVCHGVQLHITDARALRPLAALIEVLAVVRRDYPQRFAWVDAASMPWAREPRGPDAGEVWHEPVTGLLVDHLVGSADVRSVIEGRIGLSEAEGRWAADRAGLTEEPSGR